MDLSAEEIRVLGCLVEKERTTPDLYPLTTNALRSACNQKTNRDPVLDLAVRDVDAALLSLRDRRLARTVLGGGRASKHRHVLEEAWGLDPAEIAVVAVLALRGPQTPGELRARTERLTAFATTDEVVAVLDALADRADPLVTCLGRRPGQKEDRWAHLLSGGTDEPDDRGGPSYSSSATSSPASPAPAPSYDVPTSSRASSDDPAYDDPAYDDPADEAPTRGAAPAVAHGDERTGLLAGRVEELESEVEALRSELEALRDRVDALEDAFGA